MLETSNSMDMKITVSDEKPKFLDSISYSDYRKKMEEIFYAEVMPHKEYQSVENNNEAVNRPLMKVS